MDPKFQNPMSGQRFSTSKNIVGLLGWLGASFLAASMGSLFMPGEWYRELEKPTWNPPSGLFAPVWTMLYTMMAVAAWLVWRHGGFRVHRFELSLFIFQLLLNAAWTPLFFGLHWMAIAFVEIVILGIVLALTVFFFSRVSKAAGLLLVPYLAWIGFATILNFTLWRLNA